MSENLRNYTLPGMAELGDHDAIALCVRAHFDAVAVLGIIEPTIFADMVAKMLTENGFHR